MREDMRYTKRSERSKSGSKAVHDTQERKLPK